MHGAASKPGPPKEQSCRRSGLPSVKIHKASFIKSLWGLYCDKQTDE